MLHTSKYIKIICALLFLLLLFTVLGCEKINEITSTTTTTTTTTTLLPGSIWTLATDNPGFDERSEHTSVVFDDKIWVIGGDDKDDNMLNDVWYSEDGITWIQSTSSANFGPRSNHSSVVFDNKIWVIGGSGKAGFFNDVWYSSDGITWTQATGSADFSIRIEHTSVVFDNKIWLIAGQTKDEDDNEPSLNDVWYSEDGSNWIQSTSSANFSPRSIHSSVVFDNKIWVIGGLIGEGNTFIFFDDIWYSNNGENWSQATNNATLGTRAGHSCIVYNEKIYVIGGVDGDFYPHNDVWYSSDGIDWQQAADDAFDIPASQRNVIFNNKIWLIGGIDYNFGPKDEIWYSN